MTIKKTLTVTESYTDTKSGSYYGDFYYDESVLTGVSVECVVCNQSTDLEPPDGGTAEDIHDMSFTCMECGAVWNNIEDAEFELLNADEVEYED